MTSTPSPSPIEERVASLLATMTLNEKCAQLVGPFSQNEWDGSFSRDFAQQHFQDGVSYMGSHHRLRGVKQTVTYLNNLQTFLREETRLGIPALGIGEGLHGYMAHEATSFPQAIGLASAWDPELHTRVFTAVAREMRARGAHYVLSPVLDLARDPRWGRTEETYGEDPYLVSRLGVAAIRGLQGRNINNDYATGVVATDTTRVVATAKHFAAHGQPEGGANCAPANYAERTLRDEFLAPFQAAVQEAGVGSVMASYNEINGIPSHINTWLLHDVLRQEWGFQGFIISDGWGVNDLFRLHHVAVGEEDAARKAFLSGIEMELGRCFQRLPGEVQAGRITVPALDVAVARVLRLKFQLGLFDDPFVSEAVALAVTNCAKHQALALEAAHKAIVLLKNDAGLLPLDLAQLRSLAVIGPNAAAIRLGGYSGDPGCAISVLDGIRQKVGKRLEVLYAEGCGLTQASGSAHDLWMQDEVLTADPARDAVLIREAVKTAERADAVLLVLGDNEQTCREGWAHTHLGDRDTLDLPGQQEALLRAIAATGKPIILLLLHGRPASINFAAAHVPAILTGWYLGQAAGPAVADVLFGDINPGGKLPITFPRSVGQLPAYYYHKPSARRGYLFTSHEPLFAFGHGLSYTTFAYERLRLSAATLPHTAITQQGQNVTLEVDVTNTGSRRGDEVVQLYIRDLVGDRITRPIQLLKGFERISLQPGETRTVRFVVGREHLQFWNEGQEPVVEPGVFALMVGGSSRLTKQIMLEVI